MVQNDEFYKELNYKWEAGCVDPLLYQKKGVSFTTRTGYSQTPLPLSHKY